MITHQAYLALFVVGSVVLSSAAQSHPLRQKQANHQPLPYSLEQATSDEAQLHTIAFNGLAFLTGEFGADTFIPPGKVCDFFGFQYMRDIDEAHKGHNPVFSIELRRMC